VRTLPEGVYLTGVHQNANHLKFEGMAQSSTRVSSFMRNIDGSQWLRNPGLEVVQTSKGSGSGSSFVLTADEVSAATKDAGKAPSKGKIRKASLDQGARQ
jgi:type IV pilus assembly protein PilN